MAEPLSSPIELACEPQFALAGVRVHPATLEVLGISGREVLEPRVMQVLVALARSADEVVSRDALNTLCWGGRVVGDDAITRCIARLRRVADALGGFAIETVPRVGYRLSRNRTAQAPAPTPGGKPSIAVLPFANLCDAPEPDFLADGVVDEIATALTRFRSLFVVAGGSGLSLKGQGLSPQEAGRRLGVRYLLDGAVRRCGERVRISVNLIDARDGVQLWADRFDGDVSDIFRLQDEVAMRAAARIEPRVLAEEIRRAQARPAADLDAYHLFLRARALARSCSREGNLAARPLFERCLELDPHNGRLLASSASSLSFLVAFEWVDDVEGLRAVAIERAQAAVRLAPDDAEVLAFSAGVLRDLAEDVATSRALADRAVAVNPGAAIGWRASGWARAPSEPDVALEHLEHCLKLDPLSPFQAPTLMAMGVVRMEQARVDEAIALLRQSVQMLSAYPTSYAFLTYCHAVLKQLDEAQEAADRFRAVSGMGIVAFARRGRAPDWLMRRLVRLDPDG